MRWPTHMPCAMCQKVLLKQLGLVYNITWNISNMTDVEVENGNLYDWRDKAQDRHSTIFA